MPDFTTYILSRGASPEHGYCWLKVQENSKLIPENPPFFEQRLKTSNYIDMQNPSIILARSDGEYLLLVTALDTSPERSDFMGRRIRNSIAWVATVDSGKNDRLIRSLAIKALNRDLDSDVHDAVYSDPENKEIGFKVFHEKLSNLIDYNDNHFSEAEYSTSLSTLKYANDSPKNREEVIEELKKISLNSIKTADTKVAEILLLVTTVKSPSGFEKIKIWRGLSNKVPDGIGWQDLKKKREMSQIWLSLATLMIILLVIISVITYLHKRNQETLTPTTIHSKQIEIPVISHLNLKN